MRSYHVLHSLLLIATLENVLSTTDVLVAYRHNVYVINGADSRDFGTPRPLVSPALHFPQGLAFRSPSGEQDPGVVFVTDVQSGKASVFALKLDKDSNVGRVDTIIRQSSEELSLVSYSERNKSLYVTQGLPTPRVSVSRLSHDISRHWSSKPAPLAANFAGHVTSLAIDDCNGLLYWSERSNSSSVSVMSVVGLGGVHTLNLSDGSSAATSYGFNQGIHYDDHSQSLIIAATDTDNSTTSSCRFISYKSNAHHANVEGDVSVIAEHIPNCYPYSLAADEHYLYFSDWARKAVMRLSRNDPTDLVEIFETPPATLLRRRRYGAYGVLVIDDRERPACRPGVILANGTTASETVATAGGEETSNLLTTTKHENILNSQTTHSSEAKKDGELTAEILHLARNNTFAGSTTPTNNIDAIKDLPKILDVRSVSKSASPTKIKDKDETTSEGSAYQRDSSSLAPTSPSVALSTSPPVHDNRVVLPISDDDLQKTAYISAPQNASGHLRAHGESPHVLPEPISVMLPQFSRQDLEVTVFVLMVVCLLLLLTSTVLLIRQLYSCRASTSYDGSGTNDGRSSYDGLKPSDCSIVISENDNTESRPCAERSLGNADVIIDLSHDDIKVNSDLPTSSSHRRKKKIFGPKNGGIKHLISKSFTKDGRIKSSCPGLQSSDGVTLNIEDCCQMTLCETPCYTSVRKEGKDYRSPSAAADDDMTQLLDDHEQHTPC